MKRSLMEGGEEVEKRVIERAPCGQWQELMDFIGNPIRSTGN
jgi:hypothetical protein